MPDRAPLRPDVRRPRDERDAALEALSPSPRLPDRALVALSEDQEWLAMLEPVDQVMMWGIFRRDWDDEKRPWVYEATVFDTGQDAHAVLADWQEGREG